MALRTPRDQLPERRGLAVQTTDLDGRTSTESVRHDSSPPSPDTLSPVYTRSSEKPIMSRMCSHVATANESIACPTKLPPPGLPSSGALMGKEPFNTDIEALVPVTTPASDMSAGTSPFFPPEGNRRGSAECTKGGADCAVWPGQDHWRRRARLAKINRAGRCNCLARLSRRNKIMVKIVIGVLIVGVAVGIGFGISKPLGAGIWHANN